MTRDLLEIVDENVISITQLMLVKLPKNVKECMQACYYWPLRLASFKVSIFRALMVQKESV